MSSKVAARHNIPEFEELAAQWEKLRRRIAPKRDGMWSRGTARPRTKVDQGWKLHLSATLLTAGDLLQRCGGILLRSGLPFKIAATLVEVRKLNSAFHYGRSQVGKVITVYVPDAVQAKRLAEKLHRKIGELPCPEVPSDRRYKPNSNVFYRYGSYTERKMLQDGKMIPAYLDPAGRLVPDKRTSSSAVPDWVEDPFKDTSRSAPKRGRVSAARPARYRAVAAIQWRGAGGVYRALDVTVEPPATCIMKEGLRHGNPAFDGVDGFDTVRNEARVLTALKKHNIRVPGVRSLFYQNGNSYLVQDFIDGKTLADAVDSGRLSLREKLEIAVQLCQIVASMHAAGWVWRDIKMTNLIYDGRTLWAIDLEFGMRIASSEPRSFRGTSGYFLEAPEPITGREALMVDRYALGVSLQRLFGNASEKQKRYHHRAPAMPALLDPELGKLIKSLRHRQPEMRPTAAEALEVVKQSLPRRGGNRPPVSRPSRSTPASLAPLAFN